MNSQLSPSAASIRAAASIAERIGLSLPELRRLIPESAKAKPSQARPTGIRPDVRLEMFNPDCPCCQRRREQVSKRMRLYYERIKKDPVKYRKLLVRQNKWNAKHRSKI